MKRPAIAGAVALVLLLVFMVTRRQCARDNSKPSTSAKSATHGKVAVVGAASQRITDVPDWLAQAGVKPRKIAGHVVFEGKPVEGAIVRLALDASFGILQQLAEVKTTSDGAFDFGPRP